VILFDRRGLGVSDRPTSPDVMAVEKGMDDMRAVMDEVGSKRAALLGYEAGGTVMLLFAASYPDRVSALALFSTLVFSWKTPDFPWGYTEEEASEWRSHIESEWGTEEFWRWNLEGMGQTEISEEEVERLARFSRLSASPRGALAIDDVEQQVDVRAILPQIHVPTLVMSTRGDIERGNWGAGPWIAEQIPGARHVEIPYDEHFPVRPDVYRAFEAFLSQIQEEERIFDRVLATVMVTEIVGSTQRASQIGDRAWKQLIATHHQRVRGLLARFRGREVDTAGDGFLATFDGPARAVQCAVEITRAMRDLGLEIRVGLHTGEIELEDDHVRHRGPHRLARRGACRTVRSPRLLDREGSRGGLRARLRGGRRARIKGPPRPLAALSGDQRITLRCTRPGSSRWQRGHRRSATPCWIHPSRWRPGCSTTTRTATRRSPARSYWADARALAAALASGQPPPAVSVPVGFTTFPARSGLPRVAGSRRSTPASPISTRPTGAGTSPHGRNRSSSPPRCGRHSVATRGS
jgi:pimeloyl-ACP methyl ester carboxylesterase